MLVIDRTLAVLILTLAVAEKGRDHVVGMCRYLDDSGNGDCIVGTGLALLKGREWAARVFPREYQSEPNINPNECSLNVGSGLIPYLATQGVTFTASGLAVLRAAQRVQDRYNSWGAAFDTAAVEAFDQWRKEH